MATVKFSDKLRGEIRNKITNMRTAELHKHPVKTSCTVAVDDPRILAFALGEYTHLWGAVPANWYNNKPYVTLRVFDAPAPDGSIHHFSAQISPPVGASFLFPCHHSYQPEIKLTGAVGPWVEFADIPEVLATRRAITQKWENVERQTLEFFQAFPSINAAIKHTPSMMMYLPQDAIDRMEEKVERTKSAKPAITVDVDSLVGVAVSHRLGV